MNKNKILSGGGNIWQGEESGVGGGREVGEREREVGGKGGSGGIGEGREVGIGYPPVHTLNNMY